MTTLSNAAEFLELIVRPARKQFKEAEIRFVNAFTLANALFHMHEWVYRTHKNEWIECHASPCEKPYDVWLSVEQSVCNAGVIRDFANATKHVVLEKRPSTSITGAAGFSNHQGAFDSEAFDIGAFDTRGSILIVDGDQTHSFEPIADAVYEFWD